MKFYRYIVCAFLFIGAAIAETININWINDGETYAQTTCEIGGDIILPTTPTKRGHTFMGWYIPYTRLEYIESTGTQYINTRISPTENTFVNLEVLFTSNGNGYRIFGSSFECSIGFSDVSSRDFYVNNAPIYRLDYSTYYNKKIPISVKGSIFTIDDKNYNCNNFVSSSTPMYINARGDSLRSRVGSGKWYKVQIGTYNSTTGDTILRNFIPAKRNSDSVIGMYDTVSQTFFTNQGTGEFIAGPVAENQNFNE